MKKFKLNLKDMELVNHLKIISFGLGILLFLTVNNVGSPIWQNFFVTTSHIQDVPLNVKFDTDKYEITGIPQVIDVAVNGSESNVKSVVSQGSTLVATISLEAYTTAGEFDINSNQVTFNNSQDVSISPQISNFNIKVQEKITSSIAVDTTYINGQGKTNGILLDAPLLEEYDVDVIGGNDDVSSVVTVMGLIDLGKMQFNKSNDVEEVEIPLVAYNENGDVVNNVTMEPPTITATQGYDISTIMLPVNFEFINNDTKLFVSEICITSSPTCDSQMLQNVEIYGDLEKINQLDSITYQIDLSGVTETTAEVVGKPIRESNVYILDEEAFTYNIKLEEGVKKTFADVPIKVHNLDPTLTARAKNSEDTSIDIEVEGAKSVIDKLTVEQISAFVDMSSITSPGSYDLTINIAKNNNFNYVLEQSKITLEVSEKKEEKKE